MALRQDHQRGPLRGRGARPRVPTMPPAPAFQGTSVPVHTVSGVPARSSLSDPGRGEGPRSPASSCCHSEASPFLGAQFCSHMHSHTHTHTRPTRGERGHSAQVRLAEDRQQCSCSLGRGRLSPRDHDSPVPPPPQTSSHQPGSSLKASCGASGVPGQRGQLRTKGAEEKLEKA